MLDGILWLVTNTAMGLYNIGYAITHPALWLNWAEPQAIMRFAYYGGSVELFFAIFVLVLILTAAGLAYRPILWGFVRGAEALGNSVGRVMAWAGLLMVLQQTLIVFLQRIFLVSDISIGPFGTVFTKSLSWYSEELKLYNAIVVALCCAYTFIQGGHVRVDLVYGAVSRRTKKIIDMIGSLIFMMPVLILTWMYAWFFLWRHLITPKISASDTVDALLRKSRVLRWNVETFGFSPNGFNAYFLFKLLIVAFVAMMLLQALTFFYRNLLELIEGEEADGKFHDADVLGDEIAERTADIH
ncbi:TRAP transporter small permease subunit [Meridianimarinicoccus aquatilis]|uniref:TRAP transporter small permease protein n=1 Tax=Meridianimarinicoccus aquatilis TaxID=2552766 RepID=A0A4R6B3B0_9RHOB|nr:TRAP transporter small permease subunit [Fluviibacterium aquatile]QIE42310.1 TRAP transporter small permease subunit [Rhodobacteraceae bacterium SC52]TDL91287.1 TRAP transporter small permease subunit [Fluviibacterium aquatile]